MIKLERRSIVFVRVFLEYIYIYLRFLDIEELVKIAHKKRHIDGLNIIGGRTLHLRFTC